MQTSLLEARLLCGNAALFDTFRQRYDAQMDPRAFLVAKTLEMRQRHTKYENTPYALEPNCKESPGGLRDLQLIQWVARAAGLGRNWRELAASGLATPFEVQQIERNEALLFLIRARLHALAGRREDRLVFDLQTAVAETFGYRSTAPDGQRLAMRASETLMRRYYWAAKAVSQLCQILLLGIEERLNPSTHELRPINPRFFEKAGMIEVASDDLYEREPHAVLETFLLYETTVGLKDLSARTLRALYNARGVMDSEFRRDPANRALFMQILQQPAGITHAMRLMNQTSVLGRYLWPFRRIVGQMQHDLFHVYTVDQHILMVLRNVRRFFMAEHAHEYPSCSQLAAGWDKPWILYIAALFHDIGKGRGGDHSQIGAQEVRRFCRQHAAHGITREDARLIEFLVAEHLTMSQVAQKQDLSDPDVIAAFARRVGNERYLTALYLLTVADIRGTSPKVWNAWKGKLLEDLYHATLRTLGGRAPDAAAEIEARKREALVLLALASQPHEAHKKLWDTLDVSYFMRRTSPGTPATSRATWAPASRWCAHASRWRAKACRGWCMRRTKATCSCASAATSTVRAFPSWMRVCTLPTTAMRWTPSRSLPPASQAPTASSFTWSRTTCCAPSKTRGRCPSLRASACRVASKASPSRRASRCALTKRPSAGSSAFPPATVPACCTWWRACSRATASACSWPR